MPRSMKRCIEPGCEEPAGTPWTPLWCLKHDEERRARITESMEKISKSFGVTPPWKQEESA